MNILIMISLFIVLLGTIYQLFRYQFKPRFTNIGLSIMGILLVFLRQDFKDEYIFLFYFFFNIICYHGCITTNRSYLKYIGKVQKIACLLLNWWLFKDQFKQTDKTSAAVPGMFPRILLPLNVKHFSTSSASLSLR